MSTLSRDWGLFLDWCLASGECPLPASPTAVRSFFDEVPGSQTVLARRARSIDTMHHIVIGSLSTPGRDAIAAMSPPKGTRYDPETVAEALRAAPIGGWPAGLVGRRDAAVVALVCTAGLGRGEVRRLRLSGNWPSLAARLPVADSSGPCARCALIRWLQAATAVATLGWRAARRGIEELGAVSAGMTTGHCCSGDALVEVPSGAGYEPAFPAIDRRGQVGLAPVSLRSISAIVSSCLAGAAQPLPTCQRPAHQRPEPRSLSLPERTAQLKRLDELCEELEQAEAAAEIVVPGQDI